MAKNVASIVTVRGPATDGARPVADTAMTKYCYIYKWD